MASALCKEWLKKENLIRIQGWAMDGLTDEQISKSMGIAYSTFKEWKKKETSLSAALKRSKEVADREVEGALFKKAMGGDTTAMIFWLKNRKPREWRDVKRIDMEAEIASPYEGLTTKELKELIK